MLPCNLLTLCTQYCCVSASRPLTCSGCGVHVADSVVVLDLTHSSQGANGGLQACWPIVQCLEVEAKESSQDCRPRMCTAATAYRNIVQYGLRTNNVSVFMFLQVLACM